MQRWSGEWSEIYSLFWCQKQMAGRRWTSMQCFHCQTVCSGRDSWSPVSQSIWQLRQKALPPVNTKQRRTEHCKAFCQRLNNRAGSTFLHCHPETALCRSGPWDHPNQYQFLGDCVESSPLKPDCPGGGTQRCQAALVTQLCPTESCCFLLQTKPLKEHRITFLSQTQEINSNQKG